MFGCKYNNLEFNIFDSTYVESGIIPKDAKVIHYTWKYVNKKGGPDKRFKDNRKLPVCDYGGLIVNSGDNIKCRIQFSNIDLTEELMEYLNIFQEIITKEVESENIYYNFEENLNDLNAKDFNETDIE